MAGMNMLGEKFGRFLVTDGPVKHTGRKAWVCKCECGQTRTVVGKSLLRGLSKSCGCLKSELARIRGKALLTKHGHRKPMSPTYVTWRSMTIRCSDPDHFNFKRYGAKGISVCERWQSFENFLADMGERPKGKTIDRIDNTRGYEPLNCRWASWKEQAANRRKRA